MTPHEAAEKKVQLVGESSRLSERLEEIMKDKPRLWMDMRANHKTDKQTDRAWEASEMGIEEMSLRMQLKRKEKEISAINTLIRVAENEARNLY